MTKGWEAEAREWQLDNGKLEVLCGLLTNDGKARCVDVNQAMLTFLVHRYHILSL